MKKILINLSRFYVQEYVDHIVSELPDYQFDINTTGSKLSKDKLQALMTEEVVGIIAGTEHYCADLLSRASNLRVISRCGIGMDNIDSKQAKLQGIRVMNTPDAPTAAVAELTVSLMLALLREVPQHDADLRQGKWSRRIGKLLSNQRVGLIGYGRIGRAVAQLLSGFGCEVVVADQVNITCDQVAQVSLDELLTTADVVSLHCPLVPTTRELINLQTLEKMKQSAILINTARGELINEADLYDGLKEGMISAAALDVFQEEPYSGALCGMPNVIVTPHIGSCALEARREMEQACVDNLIQALSMGCGGKESE